MDAAVVIALVGVGLLVAELLLSTGGVLAALGALGLLSAVAFYFVTRKVIEAHRDEPVRTGREELVGAIAEARTTLAPEGQVWVGGTLWGARLANGTGRVELGDRVRVDAVEGLTLVVRPEPLATGDTEGEAS
jgi:membrane-bound serine protease (ClpP class)